MENLSQEMILKQGPGHISYSPSMFVRNDIGSCNGVHCYCTCTTWSAALNFCLGHFGKSFILQIHQKMTFLWEYLIWYDSKFNRNIYTQMLEELLHGMLTNPIWPRNSRFGYTCIPCPLEMFVGGNIKNLNFINPWINKYM